MPPQPGMSDTGENQQKASKLTTPLKGILKRSTSFDHRGRRHRHHHHHHTKAEKNEVDVAKDLFGEVAPEGEEKLTRTTVPSLRQNGETLVVTTSSSSPIDIPLNKQAINNLIQEDSDNESGYSTSDVESNDWSSSYRLKHVHERKVQFESQPEIWLFRCPSPQWNPGRLSFAGYKPAVASKLSTTPEEPTGTERILNNVATGLEPPRATNSEANTRKNLPRVPASQRHPRPKHHVRQRCMCNFDFETIKTSGSVVAKSCASHDHSQVWDWKRYVSPYPYRVVPRFYLTRPNFYAKHRVPARGAFSPDPKRNFTGSESLFHVNDPRMHHGSSSPRQPADSDSDDDDDADEDKSHMLFRFDSSDNLDRVAVEEERTFSGSKEEDEETWAEFFLEEELDELTPDHCEQRLIAGGGHVGLATVRLEDTTVCGEILVRNEAYDKHVSVRFTVDNWRHQHDSEAHYFCSLPEQNIDVFAFEIKLLGCTELQVNPSEDLSKAQRFTLAAQSSMRFPVDLKFALHADMGHAGDHWNNHHGKDFHLTVDVHSLLLDPESDQDSNIRRSHSIHDPRWGYEDRSDDHYVLNHWCSVCSGGIVLEDPGQAPVVSAVSFRNSDVLSSASKLEFGSPLSLLGSSPRPSGVRQPNKDRQGHPIGLALPLTIYYHKPYSILVDSGKTGDDDKGQSPTNANGATVDDGGMSSSDDEGRNVETTHRNPLARRSVSVDGAVLPPSLRLPSQTKNHSGRATPPPSLSPRAPLAGIARVQLDSRVPTLLDRYRDCHQLPTPELQEQYPHVGPLQQTKAVVNRKF
eukprot:Clim_evm21s150 gene=Clim_evmTU21s150